MIPLKFGPASVDWQPRINWEVLRQKRVDRANDFMGKYGIGAAIVYHHDHVRYLSSLLNHAYSLQHLKKPALFIKDAGFPYVFVEKALDYSGVTENCPWLAGRILTDEEIDIPHPYRYDTADHAKNQWAAVAKEFNALLKKHGVDDMPVSIDFCSPYLIHALEAEGMTVVDGNAWFDECMMVKFEEEILCMKMAATIQERAWGALMKDFRVGMQENEAFGIAAKAAFEGGAEYFEGVGFMSGDRTAPRCFGWSDRAVRPGDFLCVEIHGLNYLGYKVCYDRTFLVGAQPTELQKEIYQTVVDMQDKFQSLLKPGMTTHDLARIRPKPGQNLQTAEQLRNYRTQWSNHYGGVGIFWDSAPSYFTMDDPEIPLEKGMTLAYHSFFWLDGEGAAEGGVAIENTFLLTEKGCEALTKWPFKDIQIIGL